MMLSCYSWNVNGFRSILKHGFMDWLEFINPDILSLQEIRADWEQIDCTIRSKLESTFNICWFPSIARKGYAGAAMLTKKKLNFNHTKGLNINIYDQEGRIIISNFADITFISGYFPNASTSLTRLHFKRQFSQSLIAEIRNRHIRGEKIIMCGDMNVAPETIDLAHPKSNINHSGFTQEERQDFRAYLAEGLVDILRVRNPNKLGLYTWWSTRHIHARKKNIGWRIDHFLVSKSITDRIGDITIHNDVLGSDHCPISIEILFQ